MTYDETFRAYAQAFAKLLLLHDFEIGGEGERGAALPVAALCRRDSGPVAAEWQTELVAQIT